MTLTLGDIGYDVRLLLLGWYMMYDSDSWRYMMYDFDS